VVLLSDAWLHAQDISGIPKATLPKFAVLQQIKLNCIMKLEKKRHDHHLCFLAIITGLTLIVS